jgi:hypothetical protein
VRAESPPPRFLLPAAVACARREDSRSKNQSYKIAPYDQLEIIIDEKNPKFSPSVHTSPPKCSYPTKQHPLCSIPRSP